MSSEPILRVRELSKCYRLYDDPRQRLWEALSLGRRKLHHEFWALRDISFEVGRGESVGIIGRNGSGKSTLLQCIAGTLSPTSGTVKTRGRVAALLELGSGFNPEFTGRENVFLACAVLGLSRRETQARFDVIADFADIGEFMGQPVKTYSSGMAVRLAFAVQTAVEPDLLIVDEALAVGDIFFQQKCLARMRALREQGVAVLFVSHDMGLVRDLCEKAVYLRQHRAEFVGATRQGIGRYFREGCAEDATLTPCLRNDAVDAAAMPQAFARKALWMRPVDEEAATGVATILGVALLDANGGLTTKVRMGDPVLIRVLYRTDSHDPVNVSLVLKNRHNQIICSLNAAALGCPPPRLEPGKMGLFELAVTCRMESGNYTFSARLGRMDRPNRGVVIDESPFLGPLVVDWDYENESAPFLGMFGLPAFGRFLDSEDLA